MSYKYKKIVNKIDSFNKILESKSDLNCIISNLSERAQNELDSSDDRGSLDLSLIIDQHKRDMWKWKMKEAEWIKTSNQLEGTKRIVEEYHKGNLFVKESEKGVGTTFTIRLPKA